MDQMEMWVRMEQLEIQGRKDSKETQDLLVPQDLEELLDLRVETDCPVHLVHLVQMATMALVEVRAQGEAREELVTQEVLALSDNLEFEEVLDKLDQPVQLVRPV